MQPFLFESLFHFCKGHFLHMSSVFFESFTDGITDDFSNAVVKCVSKKKVLQGKLANM